jgi:hypothetical protein
VRVAFGGALIALLLFLSPASAETLIATRSDGVVIARFHIPEGEGWCINWRHSVQGFEVSDCYLNQGGLMVLDRSHLPDFAAGLDHIPGRGIQLSDGMGGYWIVDLNEPVPGNAYILRPGSPKVDHRITTATAEVSLSAAAYHDRVRIALITDD